MFCLLLIIKLLFIDIFLLFLIGVTLFFKLGIEEMFADDFTLFKFFKRLLDALGVMKYFGGWKCWDSFLSSYKQ